MPPRTRGACVLDTHAWLWAVSDPGRLGRSASRILAGATRCLVPAISVWEVAQLVADGRIGLDRPVEEWVSEALAEAPYELAPLEPHMAVTAARLGREGFRADPADRLIYATARARGVPLLSADTAMRRFEELLPGAARRHLVWD